MRVPLGWLRDYIDLDEDSDEIARRFASLGFPVEGIERRPKLAGVVVGKIVRLERHPNADRLQVCTIDVGAAQPLTIATAATNVADGQIIPVATVGSDLVDADGKTLHIEPRTMRGVESQGMLCSAFELGLEGTWFEDGIMQLDADTPLGVDVVELFRLRDDVLDVEITANRVDAMSIVGLARELGAALGRSVRAPLAAAPAPTLSPNDAQPGDLRLTLDSSDCRRFVAQRFSGVAVRPAPAWMRVRLALAGQRPINNLVDVSNFVMLELGQPLHFYDFERLAGRHLIVRDARGGEMIRTLDDAERTLDSRALVIADESAPQGLAGLMGALASEVTDATREIVAESANFVGPRIRRMGIALGIRTEAVSRHERGLPIELCDVGATRAAELLVAQGAAALPAFAVGIEAPQRSEIVIGARTVSSLLGFELGAGEVRAALEGLGFSVRDGRDGEQLVTPPFWRNDVAIAADATEEVARVVGYDRIEAVQAPVFDQTISSSTYRHERAVANAFASGGYREAITPSLQPRAVYDRFVSAGVTMPGAPVEILNPLSEDQRFMRFSLLPGLLDIVAINQAKTPLRLFELGHIFERAAAEPGEFEIASAAWVLLTPRTDEPEWRDSGFLTFKGEAMSIVRAVTGRDAEIVTASVPALHPGKTAALLVDGRDVGSIGAIDPRLVAAYGIASPVYAGFISTANLPGYQIPRYRPASRYPAVERDLALIVDREVPALEVESAIRACENGTLQRVHVFDEYRGPQIGENRKSIAVRITFQRIDATLTDAEVDASIATILAALRERLGAEIRA